MNRKQIKGWMKHGDFIMLDLLCMQLSFVLTFWLTAGFQNPYGSYRFRYQAVILIFCQLLFTLFSSNYSGILRRKRFDEAIYVLQYAVSVLLIFLLYYFALKQSAMLSRLHIGTTFALFVILDFLSRHSYKMLLLKEGSTRKRSVVLITSKRFVVQLLKHLISEDIYQDYFIQGVLLLDAEAVEAIPEYPWLTVLPVSEEALSRISRGWVDEVFLYQPDDILFPTELMNQLAEMGIPINYTMSWLNDERWPITDMRKIGRYKVLSTSIRFASSGQVFLKRVMDIAGGMVGCVLTGLLAVIIGPIIYLKSPGPIFFSQERVGQNGKTFRMYKFRSMYLDAEERKAELAAQNKISDGMMFKIDDDPRIIGSEKKGKDGKPKGIGNFIRNTSLDEFPQFYNVLKGEMSLVGTRPPTLDEWKKYDLEHRIRMSTKPGITGLWQVSGRSEITDFDEVVRLDREYIETWSLLLDIKILIKTVVVVLKRSGAE